MIEDAEMPESGRPEPFMRLTWTDPRTGARGYVVVDRLVGGIATGGTRMRKGCTLSEVEDLASGMSYKTGALNLPVGGAKGGIDFDPFDRERAACWSGSCAPFGPSWTTTG